jgi:hypothetical protein
MITLVWVMRWSWLAFIVGRILTSVKWLGTGWTEGNAIPGRGFSFLQRVRAVPAYLSATGSLTSVLRPSEVNSASLAVFMALSWAQSLQRTLIGIWPVSVSDTEFDGRSIIIIIIIILISCCGVRLGPLGTSATVWPIVPATDDRCWVWSSRWNENWQRIPKDSEDTEGLGATLSTTNPTWGDLGSNPGRRGGKSPVLWHGLIWELNTKLIF